MDPGCDADAVTVRLLDGRVVSLRRLGDQDTHAVLALHEQLTEHNRYLRFFTMRPPLQQLARQLTTLTSTCCAIGAFDADRLIGVVNYVIARDDPQSAEVAIAVAHDDQWVGVGTALLEHLGEIAIAHSIGRLTADVLATNYPMLQVVSDAGWPLKRLGDDAGVLHFQIELPRHRRRAQDRSRSPVGRPPKHDAVSLAKRRKRQ